MNNLRLSDRRLNDSELAECKADYQSIYGAPMPEIRHITQVDLMLIKHERLKLARVNHTEAIAYV